VPIPLLSRVIPRLPRGGKFESENPGRLEFCYLTGDPKWLAGEKENCVIFRVPFGSV
jgi:hypothetical protein